MTQITNELSAIGLLTATGGNVSATAADGERQYDPTRCTRAAQDDLVHRTVRWSTARVWLRVEWQMHWGASRPGQGRHPHPRADRHRRDHQPDVAADQYRRLPARHADQVPWYMPGSTELAEAVSVALEKSRGCILQNHGLMTVDKNLRKAATRAMLLEGNGQDRSLLQAVRRCGHPAAGRSYASGTADHLKGRDWAGG